jgi:uncharacterized protein (TIGR03546 family)
MRQKLTSMFRSILALDDTPHAVALGTAIGLFVAWTPTVGVHMILVVALAFLLRANRLAGLIAVYISNPFTILPMYWIEYKLGALALEKEISYDELAQVVHHHGWSGWWDAFWRLCIDLGGPMWLGGLLLATVNAVPAYYLTRWAVERYRRARGSPAAVPGSSAP